MRQTTDRAWFSRLVQRSARKRSGSILTTPEPTRGANQTVVYTASDAALWTLTVMWASWWYCSWWNDDECCRNVWKLSHLVGTTSESLSILTAISRWTWVSRYQHVSILDFTGSKGDGGGSNNWSYKTCKAPVKMSPSTNQPSFLQAGCSCPTNSVKALKGNELLLNTVEKSLFALPKLVWQQFVGEVGEFITFWCHVCFLRMVYTIIFFLISQFFTE